MEQIKIVNRTTKKQGTINLRFRLVDGRNVYLYHKSEIKASLEDLEKFNEDGTRKKGVSIYNRKLQQQIELELKAMRAGYAVMKSDGLDMTSETFEKMVAKQLNPEQSKRDEETPLIKRLEIYISDSYKNGIFGDSRLKHYKILLQELQRFLIINGMSQIAPSVFTAKDIMDFRLFLFDEYKYATKYKRIYKDIPTRSIPTERRSLNTVATEIKQLQAFFASLEDTDEISKSPFRKMGKANKQLAVKEQYDEPIILRKEELLKIAATAVPSTLKATKDAFLLQCNTGQRIGDFKKMTMANISVNEDGIPYIHYLADKTKKQTHAEFVAPIMLNSLEIIKRTKFEFPILKYVSGQCGYNAKIKLLLQYCEIDRQCSVYNEEKGENEYHPLWELASNKICRATCNDLVRLQSTNDNASGLHSDGSKAIERYISNWLKDVFPRWCSAFSQPTYKVDEDLNVL